MSEQSSSITVPAAQPLPAFIQRMANHGAGRFLLVLLLTLLPFILANALAKLALDGEQWLHLRNAFKVAVLTAAYCYYVRRIEQRSVIELALPGAMAELGRGFALATALIAVPVVVLWMAGFYQVQGLAVQWSLLHLFVGFSAWQCWKNYYSVQFYFV